MGRQDGSIPRCGRGIGWVAPLCLAWAGAAAAQTTGSIFGVVTDASTGRPVARARVAATGAGLPGEQSAVAEEDGRYRLTFLPPGPYRLGVSAEGFLPAARDDILLRIDKTLRADVVLVPAQVRLEEQVVKGAPPAVDVGKAESAIVVPREAFDVLPLGGTFESAAALAPTARPDGGFDGAQARENGVLVEGLDVADPLDNRLYLSVPSQFVEQLDVKTGNYLPEHGRVTAGILSAATRSGSNEFHGTLFSAVSFKRSAEPTGRLGEAIWKRDLGSPNSYDADAGFEVGGPIRKDRLWFHLGFDPAVSRTVTERTLRMNALTPAGDIAKDAVGNPVMSDLPDTATRHRDEQVTYRFTSKLTWAPTEDHTFTLAVFGSPAQEDGFTGLWTPAYRRPLRAGDTLFDAVARWNGRFLEKRLLVEVAAGWHRDDYASRPAGGGDGVDLWSTPIVSWQPYGLGPPIALGAFEAVPPACQAGAMACPVAGYVTGGGQWLDLHLQRWQAKAAVSWLGRALGTHQVKLGADVEVTRAYRRDHSLSFNYYDDGDPANGAFEAAYVPGEVRPPGLAPGDLTLFQDYESRGRSLSPAVFLQDSWQPVPSLTVNAGLRWEAQDQDNSLNADPRARIRIRDSFAPRVQAIWDPTGQGRAKVAAAWGRYYETIPLSLGTYSFWSTNAVWAAYAANSCPGFSSPGSAPYDPRTCTALVPDWGYDVQGNPATAALLPSTVPVAPDLRGQYVDQFGATAEYEIVTDLTLGVDYQGRRQGRVIEDIGFNDGVGFFIANPGEGSAFDYQYGGTPSPVRVDPRGVWVNDPLTRRRYLASYPKPVRSYDGVTFRAAKAWSGKWLALASYTWSQLRGNYAGPAAGWSNITPAYDLPSLVGNQYGLLPADRTHLVKVYAARRLDVLPRVAATLGAGYTGSSGSPVSATAAHPLYGAGYSLLVPRGMAGRTPFVNQVDLRAQVEVALGGSAALRARLDVLNALDARTPIAVDQRYTKNAASPIAGEHCQAVNVAGAPNPGAALRDACPDLAYLRALTGLRAAVNPNYGRPTAFQDPRTFRMGLELSF